jgi:hypothetical protein
MSAPCVPCSHPGDGARRALGAAGGRRTAEMKPCRGRGFLYRFGLRVMVSRSLPGRHRYLPVPLPDRAHHSRDHFPDGTVNSRIAGTTPRSLPGSHRHRSRRTRGASPRPRPSPTCERRRRASSDHDPTRYLAFAISSSVQTDLRETSHQLPERPSLTSACGG